MIGKCGLCIQRLSWLSKHQILTWFLSLALGLKSISTEMKHASCKKIIFIFFPKKVCVPWAPALANSDSFNSLCAFCVLPVLCSSAQGALGNWGLIMWLLLSKTTLRFRSSEPAGVNSANCFFPYPRSVSQILLNESNLSSDSFEDSLMDV